MKHLLALALFATSTMACNVAWPNGTDTAWHWWQCDNGPIKVSNTTPWDATGKNYEYPIHLSKPIMVKVQMNDPSYTFTDPNLRLTINLWSWGGFTGCSWSSIPTLGLLSNQDACTHGVPCPVKPGNQELDVIVDFTQYDSIIQMLQNDKPYQLQYMLHDKSSNMNVCIMVQARAEIN